MVKVRLRIDMVNGQSEVFIVRLKKDWYGDGEGEGVAVGWGGGDEMSRACC